MKWILCLLTFFSLLSCEPQKLSSDPLDEGFQKIDKGDFDGAIAYFEDLATKDSRPEVRIALASAYQGRAGVFIYDYWSFIKAQRSTPINEESIKANSTYTDAAEQIAPIAALLSPEVKDSLDNLFQMMSALDLYRERVATVPYVPQEHRSDLETGISVLHNIGTQGGQLYQAVLAGTLLRSNLDDGFDVWASLKDQLQTAFSNPAEAIKIFCTPGGEFTQWVQTQLIYAQIGVQDMAGAFPSDAEQYQDISESVSSLQSKVSEMEAALVPQGCP
jgi:hypothetical protein